MTNTPDTRAWLGFGAHPAAAEPRLALKFFSDRPSDNT